MKKDSLTGALEGAEGYNPAREHVDKTGNDEKTLGATGDPKREAGSVKPSFDDISPVALALMCEVFRQAQPKYGRHNWTEHQMRWSTYFGAIMRHMLLAWNGEDDDVDSGVDHMAHVMACAQILIEQRCQGKLIDDRPKKMASVKLVFESIMRKIKPTKDGFDNYRNIIWDNPATVQTNANRFRRACPGTQDPTS